MRTNVFLRSTRRQPVKALCLALVIGFVTFAFVGRVSEYLLIRQETERLAGYYRAIGTLEPMSRDPWADTGAAAELLAESPLVRTVNTSRRTTGILQEDFCNGDTDLWGGAADRAGNFLGGAGLRVNQYVPGYTAPSGFRDGYTLLSTTDTTGYYAFCGTLTGWDKGTFHFFADEVLAGYPEYLPHQTLRLFTDAHFDLEDPAGACAKLEKGGRYLVLGYYSAYDSRCFVSGHPDFTPTTTPDVPRFTQLQMVPLTKDSYFIPIPEGGAVDWSDPALADMGKFIREARNQQRALDITAVQDMSALPEVQEAEPDIYLTAGRWLDSADDLEGRKTCVINSHLASLRGLAVGDSITLTLRDTPSYFGYFYPFSRAEYDALEDAETSTDSYQIVGLYDYTGSFNSTAVRNTAYIPASALPETFTCTTGETVDGDWYKLLLDNTTNDASLPYPGQVSFVLTDPVAETEFFAQAREDLAVLGFRAAMLESGWTDFRAAAEPMARSSLLNAGIFTTVLVLALSLAAFVYFRMRRREIAIARAQGLPARRCVGEVSVPLLLIGLPGVLLGGYAGWRHTLENAGETLSGLSAFGGDGTGALPIPALAALLGTAFALLALLTLGGAGMLAGRPVLAQLQGNTERKVQRDRPVSEAITVSELSFHALAAAPPVPETPSWNLRQALRFAGRHVVRAPVKSLLVGALAAGFTIALGALQLAIVDNQEKIDWLYENTRVEAELFPAADRRAGTGVIRRDTIDAIRATGYVSELYLEMETTYATALVPYDRTWEAGQTTFLSAEGQTQTATLAFDDVDTFLSDAGSGGGVAITYHQGWDGSLFSQDWSGDPSALFPVVLPRELYDQYGLTPGGTIGLICMGTVRPVTAAGYYEGAASGDRAYPVLLPGSAFRTIAGAGCGRFSYCKAHMVLDPARNRELDQFSQAVLSAAKAQGTIMVGLQTAIWDEELRQAVGPLENSVALMRVLYPVVMLLSVLAAAGIAVLFIMTSAKEAAIMRIQGTTKVRTVTMLTLQQAFPCIAGLLVGLTGILLYIGGARPDLLPGLAPGAALCAALYLAAGITGAVVSSAVVTGKNPLELLQVKE